MTEAYTGHGRYGWVIAFASSVLIGIAFGTLISVSVFFKPLEAEFGWERGLTSLAYSSASLLNGVLGIAMGRLVDRLHPRPILLFGAVILGASHILLGQVEALWQLYLIYGLMVGGLGNASFLIPLMTNVSFWFEHNRGLAIGAVMAGQSVGGGLMPFLVRILVADMGWRQAYLVLGLVIWAVTIPLALLIRQPPGLAALRASSARGGPERAAISPARLTPVLSLAIVCCCICMAIPLVHLYPLSLEMGFPASSAAGVLGALMITSIAGRLGIGRISDQVGGLQALLLASGIQTVTIFWFSQMTTLPGMLAVAVAFGIGYGGVLPAYAVIIRELIPAHQVGVTMGTVFFFGNLGMSLGGYMGGLLYDLSGGYSVSYATGALAGVVNLLVIGMLTYRLRTRRDAQPLPA